MEREDRRMGHVQNGVSAGERFKFPINAIFFNDTL